jgi:hypothetical protein
MALRLIRSRGYRLVPLPFAEALSLNALTGEGPGKGDARDIERRTVSDTIIPAFTYQMEPAVPPEPLHTLGTRLLLVANDRVPPESIERMIEAVFSPRFAHTTHPPLDHSVLALPPSLDLHPGRVKYEERRLPFISNQKVGVLSNTLSVLGALTGGVVFLWQWWRQRERARQEELFGNYMLQVAGIERRAAEFELSATLQLDPLIDLQRELLRLKSDALDRFAAGEVGGQAALSDLLMPINAARDHIGDLILHVREGIEEEAEAGGKTSQTLWAEAIKKSEEPGENP